jgi:hypothetical protein
MKFYLTAISSMQKLKTSILPDNVLGSLVSLIDSPEFGTVVDLEHQWGHDGAWVLWISTGRMAWSPISCLNFLCEETESSVDEHLNG